MPTVISVENLSKTYRLGQIGTGTFAHDLNAWWARVHGNSNHLLKIGEVDRSNRDGEELCALKDVSFTVEQGEVLGIIGRNGAGKSTLLKILSRVTAPTNGVIKVKGRVASLLEVGTGFHPELTGRENVYLNGAIMGMTKAEVARKFDEIVDFAGVEKFIDTPVKRYSSGMYVRLAFAVAAHLDPEILVVDEVLAVGDAEFQKKCLGKMGEVAQGGRTVLFVSHNMGALKDICHSGILFHKGRIIADGYVGDVIDKYLGNTNIFAEFIAPINDSQKRLKILRASLLNNGIVSSFFLRQDTLTLEIAVEVHEDIKGAQIAFELLTNEEQCLFSSTSQDYDGEKKVLPKGEHVFSCSINLEMFRQGRYKIGVSSSIPTVEVLDISDKLLSFDIIDSSSPITKLGQGRRGVIMPVYKWNVNSSSSE